MSYTWEEAEAWAKQKKSIDNWRKDVAYSAKPVYIPTQNPSFRKGVPAPTEVSIDDRMSLKSDPRSVSVRDYQPREESRTFRRRQLVRRPSSDNGGYSGARKSEARSPSQTVVVERASPRRRSASQHHRVEVVREEPSPTRRSSRAPTKPPPSSFLNSFLPSGTRSNQSRAATYQKPPGYERVTYERSRQRDVSPRYRTARYPGTDEIRYKARPKSVYSSQKSMVVSRNGTRRSGSVDINDRMRLLGIRDRFRDEIDRARGDWGSESQRYREYDRRSLR